MVNFPRPRHVRHVNHAVNIILNLHEGTIGGHIADLTLNLGPLGELLGNYLPWVVHGLPQPQRYLPRIFLNFKHHRLDFVAHLQNVTCPVNLFSPRHLRNMDKPLNTLFEFDKATIGHHIDNASVDTCAYRKFNINRIPRVAVFLLEPKRHSLPLAINFENHNFNLFANLYDLAWMRDAAPRHVCNMK